MKKTIGIMAIILSLVMTLSLDVQASSEKQPEWSTQLKRNGVVVSGDYDGNFFVAKDKYNPDDLNTYSFTSKTTFEGNEKKAQKILEAAKNPGLGVRKLHEQGYTGKGVSIAYIGYGIQNGDLKSFYKHPEFRDAKIKQYVDLGQGSRANSIFSYANISALTGKTVGTAPDANIYWLGVSQGILGNNWKPIITGIEWVIKKNQTLSKADQIKVISINVWGNLWDESVKPYYQAIEKAEKAGIIVLGDRGNPYADSKVPNTILPSVGYYDPSSPNDVSKADFGVYGQSDWYSDGMTIHAATGRRTLAFEGDSYIYSEGNTHASHPYIAGIIAMGYQVNPNISKGQIVKLLMDTRDKTTSVVNPPKFIEAVKKAV